MTLSSSCRLGSWSGGHKFSDRLPVFELVEDMRGYLYYGVQKFEMIVKLIVNVDCRMEFSVFFENEESKVRII